MCRTGEMVERERERVKGVLYRPDDFGCRTWYDQSREALAKGLEGDV